MKRAITVFFLSVLAMASLCAMAQYHSLIIHHPGLKLSTTTISLSEEPVLKFTRTDLVVSHSGSDLVIPRAAFERLEHSTVSGIDDVNADGSMPVIADGMISFSCLPEGTTVIVYDAAGHLCLSEKACGECSIDVNQFGAGVYVVKVNSLTFKIVKK